VRPPISKVAEMQQLMFRSVPRWLALSGVLMMSLQTLPVSANDAVAEAEIQALAAMEAFLDAFNNRDEAGWADSLVFPHVRMASGTVVVYQDREEFLSAMDLDAFAENTGWRRSTWDDMSVIQSSAQKVHIQVRFSRFDANDDLIASFDSLYIIEPADGHWGVRARSSFAP